jgi:hypothetical protein
VKEESLPIPRNPHHVPESGGLNHVIRAWGYGKRSFLRGSLVNGVHILTFAMAAKFVKVLGKTIETHSKHGILPLF